MSNQLEASAPIPFNYKGKPITFKPFSIKDHLEITAYVRDYYMTEAKRQLVGLPLELAKAAYADAKAYADSIKAGTDEYTKAINTPEGIAYVFLMLIRQSDPSVTLDDCYKAIDDNSDAVGKAFKAAGMEVQDPLAKGETEVPEAPENPKP